MSRGTDKIGLLAGQRVWYQAEKNGKFVLHIMILSKRLSFLHMIHIVQLILHFAKNFGKYSKVAGYKARKVSQHNDLPKT